MTSNIFVLLQSKTIAVTVSSVVEFAQRNNNEDFNLLILQLFVNALGRNYALTLECLDSDAEEMQKIIEEIYKDEYHKDDAVMTDTMKSFLSKLLVETSANDLLNGVLVTKWVGFLQMIVDHPNIPENSSFKGNTLHLLSLLLCPLASLYITVQADNEDLAAAVGESLKVIVNLVPSGFAYKTLCVPIATEFITAMEDHPEVFVNETQNLLPFYKKMMLQENNVLHTMTLKSLKHLCAVQNIQEQLKNFLFEHQQQPSECDSFMSLVQELARRKHLKTDVMSLLKEMMKLQPGKEFCGDELRMELYSNVFSGSKKLVAETVALMIDMEDEPWMKIIQLMNVTENVDLPHLISTLTSINEVSCDIKRLLKLLVNNLDKPEISQRAAEVFIAMLKLDHSQHEPMLEILNIVLEGLNDELTFCLMLDCFSTVDIKTMSVFYKNKPHLLSTMIHCMTASFDHFNQESTLYNIVDVLKILTKLSSVFVHKQVRGIFQKYYLELLNVYENQTGDKSLFKVPVTKLSILFANRSWNIIPMSAMNTIYVMNQDLCRDGNDAMFPYFIRFHTNFLKQVWARLVLNKPIPFSVTLLATGISEFYSSMFELLTRDEPKETNDWILLSSLLDLALMFQPNMYEKFKSEIFRLTEIKLDKKSVKVMAMLVEEFAFGKEKRNLHNEDQFRRKMILLNWISFCKNYSQLPSLTASEMIVRHYTLKHPLKVQMDMLLEHLLTQNSIFAQTITALTFSMSLKNDLAQFKVFYQALEDFVSRHFDKVQKRTSLTCSICSFVLSKLKPHVEALMDDDANDRMIVLDYVSVMMKNLDLGMKQKLAIFVTDDWESSALKEVEMQHLEAFKSSLLR